MLSSYCYSNSCFCVCSGDEGRLQVTPHHPCLAPRLGLPPGHLPVRAVPDGDVEEEMDADRVVVHGLDGIPDLTQEVEEGPGGDVTTQDHGPTTGPEREIETGIETGTGDDIQHADERGQINFPTSQFLLLNEYPLPKLCCPFCQVPLQLTTGWRF